MKDTNAPTAVSTFAKADVCRKTINVLSAAERIARDILLIVSVSSVANP